MPRFSERVGAVKVEIQMASMNDALRNSLWNFVRAVLPEPGPSAGPFFRAVVTITIHVLKKPVDEIGGAYDTSSRDWLLEEYSELPWAEVYDFLEFVVQNAERTAGARMNCQGAAQEANVILEREYSGYRFVAGELTPITNAAEIVEIEQATKAASVFGLDGAREQIGQALSLFGKRPVPDYRNAIKEAVSAVEGVVKVINGTRGGGLHEALETVSKRLELHPAFKACLEKLYGYASNEGGVRHAIVDEASRVDEVDARFMIVTCSAIVNFLISKASAAGLLKPR
jgi:hypothetical protein